MVFIFLALKKVWRKEEEEAKLRYILVLKKGSKDATRHQKRGPIVPIYRAEMRYEIKNE